MKFLGYFATISLLLAKGAPVEADLVWAYVGSPNGGTNVAIWNPQDTEMPDDTVVYGVPPSSARGRWSLGPPVQAPGLYPASYTANPYLKQAVWYVNGTPNGTGNDLNDGLTPATPLKTIGEIMRRYGPDPDLPQTVTVNVLSAVLDVSDQPYLDGLRTGDFANQWILRGTVFPGATLGNITAVSAINHAVADGALYVTIGAIVWPAAGTRVRISGGARDGAVAYVETPNTAAGQARLSPFTSIPAGLQGDMSLSGGSIVTPVNGDTLIVETVSRSFLPLQARNLAVNLIVENMRFDDNASFTFSNIEMVGDFWSSTFNHCSFGDGTDQEGGSGYYNGSNLGQLVANTTRPWARVVACLVQGFFGTGLWGNAVVDGDTIFSACNITGLVGLPPPNVVLGNVAFYNNTAQPCVIFFADGILRFRPYDYVDGVTYGTGNQYVIRVRAATGKILVQDIDTSITIVGTAGFALIAGKTIATKQLYPVDNKGNLIISPAADASTEVGANVYPVAVVRTARNVCLTNVANLAQYAVAGNDGVTNKEGDLVVLLAQTANPQQNGPYLVGVVGGGLAALKRPDWFQPGSTIPQAFQIAISRESSVYGGARLTSDVATDAKVVDTDDPVFIPDRIVQQVTLVNGTVDITNVPIRNAAKVAISPSRTNPVGTANTIQYNPSTITAGELGSGAPKVTVQAQIAAGTINAADGSTLNVAIVQQ